MIAVQEKPESEASLGVAVLFVVLFLTTGLFTLGAIANAAREARNDNIMANLG